MFQTALQRWKSVLLTVLFTLLMLSPAAAQSAPFDIVITNGHIIDGSGSPWFSGDIGIRGGRIGLARPATTVGGD